MARILAVDDDMPTLLQIKGQLRGLGYESGILPNSKHLFKRLDAESFDLILMDLNMPGMDGLSLLKKLKGHRQHANLPVIMLTSESNQKLLAESFKYGAKDYITKPIDEMVFNARLRSALEAKFQQDRINRTMSELEKAEQDARAGIEAKDRFITNMSHEIRTPLSIVKGTLQMLSMHRLPKEKEETLLNSAYQASCTLNEMIENILDLTLHDTEDYHLQSTSVPLLELATEIKDNFFPLLQEKQLTMDFKIPETSSSLHVDRQRLKQIFFNLVGNAIKFTSPHGRIEIGASGVDDTRILTWVRDTGIGISDDFKKNAFDRFSRSESAKSVGGTGIGLTIAKQLVEVMDGKIWLESQQGQGTTFFMEFPRPLS